MNLNIQAVFRNPHANIEASRLEEEHNYCPSVSKYYGQHHEWFGPYGIAVCLFIANMFPM